MPQAGTEHELLGDDPDELRRRIRELELENALMREAVLFRSNIRSAHPSDTECPTKCRVPSNGCRTEPRVQQS